MNWKNYIIIMAIAAIIMAIIIFYLLIKLMIKQKMINDLRLLCDRQEQEIASIKKHNLYVWDAVDRAVKNYVVKKYQPSKN